MKQLLLSLALLVAVTAGAQQGPVTQSSTGTNNPVVYFRGGLTPLKITSYDLTGVEAADKLTLKSGTTRLTLLKAATATSSNMVFAKSTTLASNDVFLVQNAAGAVGASTVQTNIYQTNKVISFLNVLGTNIAAGDVLHERLLPYTVQSPAVAAATVLFTDTVTGLAGSDLLVLDSGGVLLTNTVSSVATANRFRYSLRELTPRGAVIGDSVYYVQTNTTTIAQVSAYDNTNLCVATTNGFADADIVFISTTRGLSAVRVIDTAGVSTTNLTLTVAAGFATAAGDRVTVIGGARTLVKPVVTGDSTILLDALTAMAEGTNIVINPTSDIPWQTRLVSTNTVESTKSITLGHKFNVAVHPGQMLYEASLTGLTTTFASDRMDSSVICDVATAVAAGDVLYIFPATAVPQCFQNTVTVTPTDYTMSSVTNSAANGVTLAAGDYVWTAGNTATFIVGSGNATRDNASGIWAVPGGRPASATLTTTNGLIRNITGNYGP